MRSRRRQFREKRKIEDRNLSIFLKILLPVFFILAAALFLWVNTKYWNGKDKFIYVSRLEEGSVKVVVLDPALDEETDLIIPGETEVTLARNLGTLSLKNVWQLGANEKIGGDLLAETVSRNFLFPVSLWKDSLTKTSNIPLGDKLFAEIMVLGIKSVNRNEVDLGKSQFLSKVRLKDGSTGYRQTGPLGGVIMAYFSDNYLAGRNLKLGIVDATGSPGVAGKAGQIVEVMGAKVVSIDKRPLADTDCSVSGKDARAVRKIASLFSCKMEGQKTDFDVEIDLGTRFAKRF